MTRKHDKCSTNLHNIFCLLLFCHIQRNPMNIMEPSPRGRGVNIVIVVMLTRKWVLVKENGTCYTMDVSCFNFMRILMYNLIVYIFMVNSINL